MDNLIEVEIENNSYIKLQDLDQSSRGNLNLTTLVDNQPGVIIRIFLNKNGERILIKNLEVRHLSPKVSGLPRFELGSSYIRKKLYLTLKVDGKKVDDSEIKLAAYLRNKYLPLYIILGIIVALLLIIGAGRLLRTTSHPVTSYQTTGKETDTSGIKSQPLKYTTNTESNIESKKIDSATEKEPAERTLPNQSDSNQTDTSPGLPDNAKAQVGEQKQTASLPAAADISSSIEQIVYFSPNNTRIDEDASLLLKEIAVELKKYTNAEVEISGHCAMSGTEAGREELSRERAYNIVSYLKQEGWNPKTEPVVRWYGGTQPVTFTEDDLYRNRRVEIIIVLP